MTDIDGLKLETTAQLQMRIDLGEMLNEHGSLESVEMYEAISLEYDRLLAEVARLKAELAEMTARSDEAHSALRSEVMLVTAREAAARAEEREECAKLVETLHEENNYFEVGDEIAAAIRARSAPEFTRYRRKLISELRPYQRGEDMTGISISTPDRAAGSPKYGDMIARNPKNHADQWLVAAQYFADTFEPIP